MNNFIGVFAPNGLRLSAIPIKQYGELTLCLCQERLVMIDQDAWILKSMDIADFVFGYKVSEDECMRP